MIRQATVNQTAARTIEPECLSPGRFSPSSACRSMTLIYQLPSMTHLHLFYDAFASFLRRYCIDVSIADSECLSTRHLIGEIWITSLVRSCEFEGAFCRRSCADRTAARTRPFYVEGLILRRQCCGRRRRERNALWLVGIELESKLVTGMRDVGHVGRQDDIVSDVLIRVIDRILGDEIAAQLERIGVK